MELQNYGLLFHLTALVQFVNLKNLCKNIIRITHYFDLTYTSSNTIIKIQLFSFIESTFQTWLFANKRNHLSRIVKGNASPSILNKCIEVVSPSSAWRSRAARAHPCVTYSCCDVRPRSADHMWRGCSFRELHTPYSRLENLPGRHLPSFILFLKPYIGPMFSFLPSCSNLNLLVFLYTWPECKTNNQRGKATRINFEPQERRELSHPPCGKLPSTSIWSCLSRYRNDWWGTLSNSPSRVPPTLKPLAAWPSIKFESDRVRYVSFCLLSPTDTYRMMILSFRADHRYSIR